MMSRNLKHWMWMASGVLWILPAVVNSPAQPFVGYDFVRPPSEAQPANRSPYEDLTNTSVYEMTPMNLDAHPEPTGELDQPYPQAHSDPDVEPVRGVPEDMLGPNQIDNR